MSRPVLPFVDFRGTPKLRFAVLKLMFPRGRVLRNAFEHVDGDFSMRAGSMEMTPATEEAIAAAVENNGAAK